MAQTLKNVLIIGASGNIGSVILKALVESKAFNVTAVSRKTSEATFPADVKVHKSDMSDDDLLSAFKGQDVIISSTGATGFQDQIRLIDLAVKAGVKRFLPSEFSVNVLSKTAVEILPLFSVKVEVLNHLRAQEDHMSWTGLATGFLFDWGFTKGLPGIFGFNLNDQTATIWDGGNARFSVTNQDTFTQALISVLQHPAETANRYIHVASFTVTQNEILAAFKAASPTREWKMINVTSADQIKIGNDMLATGDMNGVYFLVKTVQLGNLPGLKNDFETQEKLWNDVLGLPKESLEETVKKLVS